MTLQEFVIQNRTEIKRVAIVQSGLHRNLDDISLEVWVENNEYLYNLACDAGVDYIC